MTAVAAGGPQTRMPLRHYEDVMLDEFRRWQAEQPPTVRNTVP